MTWPPVAANFPTNIGEVTPTNQGGAASVGDHPAVHNMVNSTIQSLGILAPQNIPLMQVYNVNSYGAVGDGVTDDTAAIRAAASVGAGGTVYFPPPSVAYLVTGSVAVTQGTTLRFDDATFKIGASVSAGIFAWSVSNVSAEGKLTVNANSYPTPFFKGTSGGNNFWANIQASYINAHMVSSPSTYLFSVTQCNGVRIGGYISSGDGSGPWLVYIDRGSDIEISDVITPVGLNATGGNGQFSPVMVTDSTGVSSVSNISIHDCTINGGGTINSWPLIWVGGNYSNQGNTTSNVAVSNCVLSNTASTADALDIVLASYVMVTNVATTTSFVGIDITACVSATVTNCTCYANRGYGFAAGDPFWVQGTYFVTFMNCQAYGNGNAASVGSSQYLVYSPTGKQTNQTQFEGCVSFPESQSQYDITIAGAGTVTQTLINGGYWAGGTVGHLNDTLYTTNHASFYTRGAYAINPGGNLAASTPNVPSSTTALTNTTGFDCTVIVYANGASVTEVDIGGVNTGLTVNIPFHIPYGQTIKLTYTGGTPTWSWFAD